MQPMEGYNYLVTHPRTGAFIGHVESISTQDVDHERAGLHTYVWVKLTVVEPYHGKYPTNLVPPRKQLGPGDTIELLSETTFFERPPKKKG